MKWILGPSVISLISSLAPASQIKCQTSAPGFVKVSVQLTLNSSDQWNGKAWSNFKLANYQSCNQTQDKIECDSKWSTGDDANLTIVSLPGGQLQGLIQLGADEANLLKLSCFVN